MSRPRIHADATARQRACRERRRQRLGADTPPAAPEVVATPDAPFRVVGPGGQSLLEVGIAKDGVPYLCLFDGSGNAAAVVVTSQAAGILALAGPLQNTPAILLHGADGAFLVQHEGSLKRIPGE